MELLIGFLFFFILLACLAARDNAKRKERVKQAYEGLKNFGPEPVHGTRKFATDEQLRKAGLL